MAQKACYYQLSRPLLEGKKQTSNFDNTVKTEKNFKIIYNDMKLEKQRDREGRNHEIKIEKNYETSHNIRNCNYNFNKEKGIIENALELVNISEYL